MISTTPSLRAPTFVIASVSEATQGFRDTSTAATHQPPRLLRRDAPRNDGDGVEVISTTPSLRAPTSVIASVSEATQGFRGTSTAATHQPPRLLRRNAPRNDGDVCVQLPLTVIASVSEATQGFRDTSTAAIPETPGLLRRFAPRNDGAGDALLAMTARGMRSLQLRRGDALLPMTARCCASPNCGA